MGWGEVVMGVGLECRWSLDGDGGKDRSRDGGGGARVGYEK